jgi:aspartate aminotransferase
MIHRTPSRVSKSFASMADDVANLLAEEQVYCLPGKVMEMPGYFRISLAANDKMIERAIPRFAAVRQRVG